MTASDHPDGVQWRSELELLRLTRLAGEYDAAALQAMLAAARGWLSGRVIDLSGADTAFLVEGLFKCGRLAQAAQVTKERLARGEAMTAYDDFAQQYQRLASYDFALPQAPDGPPLFPHGSASSTPRVLSLYHSSISFQTSGYTVRSQALLANSKLDVVPLTRIGYPWAAKIAKGALAKVGKLSFETTSDNVRYRHRHGAITHQSHTFSNIALSKHEILKVLSETRPHVVHAASNFVNALPALLAARAASLPFVYEMRGLWELTAGVGIPGWLDSERYLLERRIETFVARSADRVFVLSDVQKRELVERGVDESKIRVVINGHDPQRVGTAHSSALLAQHCPGLGEWIAGRTVIGYAGALAVYEGLQDLLATFAEHRSAWSNVAVVIAGDGPYLYQLQAQVAALGLEDRVKLLGRVPGEVADALYGVVDLCILPRLPDLVSQLITPLKTVEILSHGKVLLASNVGAMAEQVGRYGYGETFVAGDRADLGCQLSRVLAELPALKTRYAGATARIAEGFSWASIAKEWDALLAEVASAPRAAVLALPARNALAPLYDDRPVRLLEALSLWRRVARSQLLIEGDYSTYLRFPVELDGQLRVVAVPEGSEVGQLVQLGSTRSLGQTRLCDLRSLAPGKYQVFLYVPQERLLAAAVPEVFGWMQAPDPWNADEVSESHAQLRWERRRSLAFEVEHDAKNPTELEMVSEHIGTVRVAASYLPLTGAELNANFTQRTKSKITGTRFHYITVASGNSELQLFPRMSGRLMVELTPWGEGEVIENRLRQVSRVRTVPRDASLFPELDRTRSNVLVAANINETLLDGSTIWLKTLANTLAGLSDVNVYVATNSVHVANGVTAELFDKPNVAKIDLLSSAPDRASDFANQLRMLDRTSGGFDLIVVRGREFAKGIVDRSTRDRVVYYGAGMFHRAPDGALVSDEAALRVAAKCSAVIFQNAHMERLFREHRPAYRGACYCIAPCVEEAALATAVPPALSATPEALVVYAGKLIREYGVLELAQAVGARLASGKRTRLVILGNKLDGRDPAYQGQLDAALAELGDAVSWLQAVAPSVALGWMRRADAVWGWRHGEFENSHFEISTKMVEAISSGTPIVLYPAQANVALLGADYVGFGEQAAGAASALERLLLAGRQAFAPVSERLKERFQAVTAYRPLLERVASAARRREGRGGSKPASRPSVLVAAHDFRFFEDIEACLLRDGHAVSREYWKNHTVRYTHGQARAAEQADVIFCEWCLGNAVWWSNNLPSGKRLIIRLHLQEIQTTHPAQVDFSRVEKIIFISPHIMREAIAKFGIPPQKCEVIPISVRLDPGPAYTAEEVQRRRLSLGMVGLTPWRKRPDRALEVLLALRERHPQLTLHLKGHTPSEYAWMSNRKEELRLYHELFGEIARLERLGVVRLSGYDDQLEPFYRDIGWILSLSDFEGCHTAVAEGGAMGCLPLMTNWGGADEVYPSTLVRKDVDDVVRYFEAHYETFAEDCRAHQAQFQRLFGIDDVFKLWRELFLEKEPSGTRISALRLVRSS